MDPDGTDGATDFAGTTGRTSGGALAFIGPIGAGITGTGVIIGPGGTIGIGATTGSHAIGVAEQSDGCPLRECSPRN